MKERKRGTKHKCLQRQKHRDVCHHPIGSDFEITHFIYHWLESAFECKAVPGGRSPWCWVVSKTCAGSDPKMCPFCSSGLTWVSGWLCPCTKTSAHDTCMEEKEKLQGKILPFAQ